MRARIFLISTALSAFLGLAACVERVGAPAPVLHLGVHPDSISGAVMVQEGDNLWRVAQRYRLPLRDIIDLNNMTPPYALRTGQRLRLPPPLEHKVGERDTLYGIARIYGVPVSQLVRNNGLKQPYTLKIGQVVRIPSSRLRQEQQPVKRVAKASAAERGALSSASPSSRKEDIAVSPVLSLREASGQNAPQAVTTLRESARPGFVWPVRGKVISSYGAKAGGLYNEGINIAAPRGTPVASAADGVVAYVGNDLASYGNLVLIRHGGGIVSAYAHMDSVTVSKGSRIYKGQTIGTVGTSGTVSNAQLHFEIRKGTETLDPLQFLG